MVDNQALRALRYHVSGAIARGESVAIVECPRETLHTGTDSAGRVLFGADTPEAFRAMVCDYLERAPWAAVIEEQTHKHPAPAFPFTVWTRHAGETLGTMHKTRADAVRECGRI